MKKGVLAGVAALTLFDVVAAATAAAQNMGVPDVFIGSYAGMHGGYRWGEADFTSSAYTTTLPGGGGGVTFPARGDEFNPDGGIAGLHLGHNRAVRPNWIAGVEGDVTWGRGDGIVARSSTIIAGDAFAFIIRSSNVEFNWQATLRGRIGRISGDWLFYATGGVALLDVGWNETITVTVPGFAPATFTHKDDSVEVGFTVGGGIEKALNNKWTARGEFLYENFGSISVPHGATAPPQSGKLDNIDAYKLRFGLTRKIGG